MGILKWLFGGRGDPGREPKELLSRKTRLVSPCAEVEAGLRRQMENEVSALPEKHVDANTLKRGVEDVNRALEQEQARLEALERRGKEQASGNTGGSFSVADGAVMNWRRGDYDIVAAAVERQKSFGRMLMQYVNERCDGKASVCYQRAGVSRQLYSRIISDLTKSVAKRTVLQLCVGLRLNRQEAERFLSFAGYAFSPSSFEDTAFAWCLEQGVYSIFDVNELLVLGGCKPVPVN